MAKAKLIILDLDRTIFDCDRFYVDVCNELRRGGAMTARQLTEATVLLNDPEANLYLDGLALHLKLNPAEVTGAVAKLASNRYLYKDVPGFLERMGAHQILILTTGNPLYQEMKFQASPLLAGCRHQIIDQINKGEYIRQRLLYTQQGLQLSKLADGEWYEELYLVDDRNYNLNSLAEAEHVKLFHIRRPTEKVRDLEIKANVQAIKSLKEVA